MFAYVLFGVVIVGVIGGVVALVMSSKAYEQIGKGGFFDEGAGSGGGGGFDAAERDDEIRQMLTARNARHAASGRDVVDVEEELTRLTAPKVDAELRAEIREHVLARNLRRLRRGQEPLDVDAEVERAVRELGRP